MGIIENICVGGVEGKNALAGARNRIAMGGDTIAVAKLIALADGTLSQLDHGRYVRDCHMRHASEKANADKRDRDRETRLNAFTKRDVDTVETVHVFPY